VGKKDRALLTRTERLNHEMDSLAKAYWNTLYLSGHSMTAPIHPVHNEGWSVYVKETQEKLHTP
jgi:hypothetical protein